MGGQYLVPCRYTVMFECKNQLFQKTTKRIPIVSYCLVKRCLGSSLSQKFNEKAAHIYVFTRPKPKGAFQFVCKRLLLVFHQV